MQKVRVVKMGHIVKRLHQGRISQDAGEAHSARLIREFGGGTGIWGQLPHVEGGHRVGKNIFPKFFWMISLRRFL